jgi:glycosyltransferase involved in cell wall biosynthesis
MAPTVSIIIPCYRARATILETINGVLDQTLTDWECILVSDDGTSYLDFLLDNGVRDPRIVEHPERSDATGTVAPRNRGFSLVRGAYVADLDADDIWAPERLERLVPLAEQYGAVQDLLECFDENVVLGWSGPPDGNIGELTVQDVVAFDFPFHLVVRRDCTGALWSPHDSWIPDVIRTMLLAAVAPVAWLHAPLLRYRVSASSMSQSLAGSQKIDAAYDDALACLTDGDGYGLHPGDRRAAGPGIARKKALNQRYIREMEGVDTPLPFIAWALANGHAGAASGQTA